MNWKTKALIASFCNILPFGNGLYVILQKKFGRLNGSPSSRLDMAFDMFAMLKKNNISVIDMSVLEVGTGHKAILPVAFSLLGTKSVITVDLNKRLDAKLMNEVLNSISTSRKELEVIFSKYSEPAIVSERFDLLDKHKDDMYSFFESVNIHYLSPADASRMKLADNSIDLHYSTTVLEHIPYNILSNIFKECQRLLSPTGVAIHYIDITDHFSHQDSKISKINYLKFSGLTWKLIAGNEFSYTNRLRASEYRKIFYDSGFIIDDEYSEIGNFFEPVLHKLFREYSSIDINTTTLNVLLRKKI